MGARPEEYLTYVRQFHPFGNQEKYEVTKTEDTLSKGIQRYHGYSDALKT